MWQKSSTTELNIFDYFWLGMFVSRENWWLKNYFFHAEYFFMGGVDHLGGLYIIGRIITG